MRVEGDVEVDGASFGKFYISTRASAFQRQIQSIQQTRHEAGEHAAEAFVVTLQILGAMERIGKTLLNLSAPRVPCPTSNYIEKKDPACTFSPLVFEKMSNQDGRSAADTVEMLLWYIICRCPNARPLYTMRSSAWERGHQLNLSQKFELVVSYRKLIVRTALSLQTATQLGAQRQTAYFSDMLASTIRKKSLSARTARKKVRKDPRWLEHKCWIAVGNH